MICPPCTAGDHCGTSWCSCQHLPPGTGQPQRTARMKCAPVPTTFTPRKYTGPALIAEPKTDPVPPDVAAMQAAVYRSMLADPARPEGAKDAAHAALSAPVASSALPVDDGDPHAWVRASDGRLADYLNKWQTSRKQGLK